MLINNKTKQTYYWYCIKYISDFEKNLIHDMNNFIFNIIGDTIGNYNKINGHVTSKVVGNNNIISKYIKVIITRIGNKNQ